MAVVTLLPEQVRDSVSRTITVGTGQPRIILLKMLSSVFGTDPTLTFAVKIQQSFDGGVNFEDWYGSSTVGGTAGQPIGKGGAISDGLWFQNFSFDGLARTIQVVITVNRPFSWGLTADTINQL